MSSFKCLISAAAILMSCAVSAVLPTGSPVKQLPSPLFLDDSTRTLNDFFGKKFIVLHIWEMNQAALQEFSYVANTAGKYRGIADFIGVGIGTHEKLKSFPGAVRLGFPVNSDRGKVKELFLRPGDSLPLTVLLDKNGTLLWRGPLRQLPRILTACNEGKFDLKEQIRLEIFSDALNKALAAGNFEDALKLVQQEFAKHPRMALLKTQLGLLIKLNRQDEAFALIHEQQKKFPANYRIYEQEYLLIGETDKLDKLPDFFDRLIKNFSERPDVLLAFATAESKLPPDKLNMHYVFKLLRAGWQAQKFSSPEARAMYALDYAKLLHTAGRNDLAIILVQEACRDLKNSPDKLARATAVLAYYTKIKQIAPELALPDLKK